MFLAEVNADIGEYVLPLSLDEKRRGGGRYEGHEVRLGTGDQPERNKQYFQSTVIMSNETISSSLRNRKSRRCNCLIMVAP